MAEAEGMHNSKPLYYIKISTGGFLDNIIIWMNEK
jgi:hypothetical protein